MSKQNESEPKNGNKFTRRDFLKISESTMKRMIKNGIIKAYKVSGQYRIWGSEILKILSPELGSGIYKVYKNIREKTKETIKKW